MPRPHDHDIELHGKAKVEGLYRMVFGGLKEEGGNAPHLVFENMIVDGELVALRFLISGHHVGAFMGVPAMGRAYVLNGITMLRFSGDRVVERWSSADMLGLLIQIGAVPPPTGV